MDARRRRRIAATGLAGLALLAGAPAADALPSVGTIVPGRSMAGLALGASFATARAVWGEPTGCSVRADARGRRTGPCWYGPRATPAASFAVLADRVRLLSVERRTRWETATGVNVGASRASLERAYGPELVRRSSTLYRIVTRVAGRRNQTDFVVQVVGGSPGPGDVVTRILVRRGPRG